MNAIVGVTGGKTHLAADWDESPNATLFPACRSGGSTSRNNTTYVATRTTIDCTRCAMMAAARTTRTEPTVSLAPETTEDTMTDTITRAQVAALRTGTAKARTHAALLRLGLMDSTGQLTDAGRNIRDLMDAEGYRTVSLSHVSDVVTERAQEPYECPTCGEPADADGRIEHRPGTPCTTDYRAN